MKKRLLQGADIMSVDNNTDQVEHSNWTSIGHTLTESLCQVAAEGASPTRRDSSIEIHDRL